MQNAISDGKAPVCHSSYNLIISELCNSLEANVVYLCGQSVVSWYSLIIRRFHWGKESYNMSWDFSWLTKTIQTFLVSSGDEESYRYLFTFYYNF